MIPNDIKLESLTLNFEYEKLSRDIDSLDSLSDVKNLAKCFIKLYFSQQEAIKNLSKL